MHIYYIYVCAYSISMINPPEVSHSRLVLCCDRVQSLAADATWLTGGASPTSKTSLKSESLTWTGGLKGSIPGWSAIGSWCGEAWNERSSWGKWAGNGGNIETARTSICEEVLKYQTSNLSEGFLDATRCPFSCLCWNPTIRTLKQCIQSQAFIGIIPI